VAVIVPGEGCPAVQRAFHRVAGSRTRATGARNLSTTLLCLRRKAHSVRARTVHHRVLRSCRIDTMTAATASTRPSATAPTRISESTSHLVVGAGGVVGAARGVVDLAASFRFLSSWLTLSSISFLVAFHSAVDVVEIASSLAES